MKASVRAAIAVVVLAGVGLLLYEVFAGSGGKGVASQGDAAAVHESMAVKMLTDSKSCQTCHPTIYKEWKESWHGQAWTEHEVRALSGNFKQEDCIPCHAPRPLSQTGLGQLVFARTERRPEGVDCLSCHLGKNGMIGPHKVTGPDVKWPKACDPVEDKSFIASEKLCLPCHNQHQTYSEWKVSAAFKAGKDCNDCHMPEVPGPPNVGSKQRTHFSHDFRGGHAPDFIRSALTFKADVRTVGDGGKAGEVTVRNDACGHNFPTDSRNRAVDVMYTILDKGGAVVREGRLYRFRNPYVTQIVHKNRELKPQQQMTFSVDLPDGGGTFIAKLYYRHNPFEKDKDSLLLFEKKVPF